MEPVGLAVGLLGLAGLFNNCLDILDKFDSWRDYGNESRSLSARFKAHKLQLEKWGQAIGFVNGSISDKHDKLLDDPRTLSTVEDLLSAVKDICGDDSDMFPSSKSTINKLVSARTPVESKRQKLSWALRDKAKRITQVEQFSSIVVTLHSLIPIKEEGSVVSREGEPTRSDDSARHLNDAFFARGDWFTEFQRVLKQIESQIEAETRRDLQTWLLGNHLANDRYEEYMAKRMESTCEWILNRPWFLQWSSPDFPKGYAKVLWLNGPAGFGKSVLCAKVIDHLSSMNEAPVAHFFFSSDSEREDPSVVVRSWVAQVMSHPIVFSLVQERWGTQRRQKATRQDLIILLGEIVLSIPGCTFIMDGLDECIWLKENQTAGDGDSIPGFMKALWQAIAGTSTHLMIVSRDEPEIRTCLPNDSHGISLFEHKITPEDVQSDVVSYSRSIVYGELKKSTDATKEKLSQKLAERCNGQFLWVRLQQKSLRRHSWKSQKELEREINATPTGLADIYERNWMKILSLPEEDRARAFSLLRWTAFSLRPLTVAEMTEALLISEQCDEVRVDELPDNIDGDYIDNGISFYCGSLLEIRSPQAECDAGLKTIHLAHFSVKQYLIYNVPTDGRLLQLSKSLGSFTEPIENILISKMCLRYINSPTIRRGESRVEDTQVLGAFYNYAAGSWQQHASIGDPRDAGLAELVNQLFDIRRPNWVLWREWFDFSDEVNGEKVPRVEDSPTSPMYYAARLGLINTVKFLIHERKHSTDESAFLGRTALIAACEEGNIGMAKTLLENGADIELADNDGRTPVIVASAHGHVEMVKFLFNKRAEIKAANTHGWTSVMVAASHGHLEVVGILLDNGADLTITDNDGWTPVIVAASKGYIDLVKLLLNKGADVNAAIRTGWTPLNIAASRGHLEMVRLLLDNGAGLTIADNDGWTPVIVAATYGHPDVVRHLLDHGADITVANNDGWTSLNTAASNGHLEVVRLLLDHGADITIANNDGWTPVIMASAHGHLEVIKALMGNRVDLTIGNTDGWTPIHMAASNGHLDVVRFFLVKGAKIEVTDNDGLTAIDIAASKGHLEVVSLLLDHGADITVANNDGLTAINIAASNGHLEVVRLLLDHGADPTVANHYGLTPVNMASTCGHLDVIKLLLDNGADIRVADKAGRTPLHIASQNCHIEIIKLLHQTLGASVDVQDDIGRTSLFLAAARGHSEVLQLLLSYNALLSVRDRYNATPLCVAIRNGHEEAAELLLSRSESSSDFEGGIGGNLAWWAAKTGCTNIIELVRNWAQKMDIDFSESDFSVDYTSVTLGQPPRWCDVCTRYISSERAYFRCKICHDFDICLECHGFEVECLDPSHDWTLCNPDSLS